MIKCDDLLEYQTLITLRTYCANLYGENCNSCKMQAVCDFLPVTLQGLNISDHVPVYKSENQENQEKKKFVESNYDCKNDLKSVIDFYGPEAQARIAMEECAELIQAINKCLRYPDNEEKHTDLVEEMADVAIMFNQLMLIFNVKYDEFNVMIKKKTERILNRLEAEKKKAEV